VTSTEWALQEHLTDVWSRDGVEIGGQLHMLVAWEVMAPSWQINDARGKFDEPSIDFLVVDRAGRLTAMELKRAVSGIKPAWRVLCQVTHRAVMLKRDFSREQLEGAYLACASGAHGRVGRGEIESLSDRHRWFFDLSESLELGQGGFGRVVAATAFGPSWTSVQDEFNALEWTRLIERLGELGELQQGASRREGRRLSELDLPAGNLVGPVSSLLVVPTEGT
jgi:hypothetical protein